MKERRIAQDAVLWTILLALLIVSAGSAACAGELRDYTLPSQKRYDVMINTLPSRAPAMQGQVAIVPSGQAENASVYDQFRGDVKSLTPQQRKILKETLQTHYGTLAPGEEKSYYHKLIAILDECGTK
jgi:hypothetical protein